MTPPHMQIRVLSLVRAGMLPMRTVGAPMIQGAVVGGTHGMGVKTPRLAAQAALDQPQRLPDESAGCAAAAGLVTR